jgi:Group II intron, maturase-specific domain
MEEMREHQLEMIDVAQANANSAFDFARDLALAKTPSQLMDLCSIHAQNQLAEAPPEQIEMCNQYIQGWINYYGNFYRTKLRPALKRIDLYVIRWARRKFKRLRRKTKGARDWFDRLRRANPTLFAHWQLCHGNGRTSGAV